MRKTKAMCQGCRNDFYNGKNDLGVSECWSFKTAKIETRYRIGHWTPMDRPENFHKERVLGCYHQPGRYVWLKELPAHIKVMRRRKTKTLATGADR